MMSMSDQNPDQIRGIWEQIFFRYGYMDRINKLSAVYPEEKSLYVSFKHIQDYDKDFATSLTIVSEFYIRLGEEVLRELIHPPRGNVKRVNIRLTDFPENEFRIEIRDLRSPNVGTLLTINGIIRKNTEVLPRLQTAAFRCEDPSCGHVNMMPQERGKVDEPAACELCGKERNKTKFKLLTEESEFVDFQKLEIQENPETLDGGSQPQRITVIVEDDLTGKIFPGDRIMIDGILRAEQKRAGSIMLTEFNIYVYALNFRRVNKEIEDVKITEEDEKAILDLSKEPNIIEKLSASIAPTIFGMEMVKKTLVLQMFGGIRKTMKDGTTMRGDIHVLMVGDPGTAKSQLLKYMTELSPRGVFAFGRGSSAAGLTAAAIRDDFGEGRWTLEAGALVLADNGFAAIDELDKMDEKDTAAMHEAMEQQTVTISKAGIMATLKSRCSILGAANPKFGRYDQSRTIVDQIDFPPPLLSRFDVIFKIIDKPDRGNDDKLAMHVLRAHRVGEIYKSLEQNDITGLNIPEEMEFNPPVEKDMVRKYVSYAKGKVFPRLSDEAINLLREEYVKTRSGNPDSIPITARQLESTIRLAEAAARARLSSIVTEGDAMLAKQIVDYYLKDVSTHNGEVDIDVLYTGTSSKQRNDLETVFDIIRELKKEKNSAEIDEVISLSQARGLSVDRAEEAISNLKRTGQIYEPSYKKLDVIR